MMLSGTKIVNAFIGTFAGAVVGALTAYFLAASDRREASINAAWQRVNAYETGQYGGSGLIRSIELLARERESLRRAMLHGANLFEIRLEPRADLAGAILSCANLQSAHLPQARLNGALLFGANLRGAVLTDADLGGAYFLEWNGMKDCPLANWLENDSASPATRGVYLEEADLYHANIKGVTGVTCADLRKAKHWEDAYRDACLACGADIPEPTEVMRSRAQPRGDPSNRH